MNYRLRSRCSLGLAAGAALFTLAGCGSGIGSIGANSNASRTVLGSSQSVGGSLLTSYEKLDATSTVTEVGVVMPFTLILNPPTAAGTGPAGAQAVLTFPAEAAATTFFNHFELDWNPSGHPPAVYMVPHFDFHFFDVPVDQVKAVQSPDPAAPAANRVPFGYTYPGTNQTVPEMGTHAIPNNDLAAGAPPFTKTFIVGYYNGKMTFLEPMITRAFLQSKQSFSVDVPQPVELGQAVRYPQKFNAIYDPITDTYTFSFTNFTSIAK